MTLRARLVAMVAVVAAGILGMGGLVLLTMNHQNHLQAVAKDSDRILQTILTIAWDANDYVREARGWVLFGGTPEESSSRETVVAARDRVLRSLDHAVTASREGEWATLNAADRKEVLARATGMRDAIMALDGRLERLASGIDVPDRTRIPALLRDILRRDNELGIQTALRDAAASERAAVRETDSAVMAFARTARLVTVSAAVVLTAGVVILLWLMVRRMTRGLEGLVGATREVAKGNFAIELPATGEDEFAVLARAFNRMAAAILRRSGDVREANLHLAWVNEERAAKNAELAAVNARLESTNAMLATNVAALEQTQAQLVQSGKLAAVGQLASGLAHEINNPLGVILGFAQGMERRLEEGDPMRLPVTSIVREGLRCKSLIKELLTFARIANKVTERCDLNQLVTSTVVLLAARARTQHITVATELGLDRAAIEANPVQLQQVLVNLGTNALDAMTSGGRLTIRTRSDGDDAVILEVSDDGSGIPLEAREHIFEPFFTTKEVGKGTGLGLSLAHEIVRQHAGTIAVETQIDAGTTFTIRLPRPSPGLGADPTPLLMTDRAARQTGDTAKAAYG